MSWFGHYHYWIVILLMMSGLYIVMARRNMIKQMVGVGVFQASVALFYISMGKVAGGTAPIITESAAAYSNPLPHALILTAIVVGVATLAVGLALIVRIREAYGTIEDDEIQRIEHEREEAEDQSDRQAGPA